MVPRIFAIRYSDNSQRPGYVVSFADPDDPAKTVHRSFWYDRPYQLQGRGGAEVFFRLNETDSRFRGRGSRLAELSGVGFSSGRFENAPHDCLLEVEKATYNTALEYARRRARECGGSVHVYDHSNSPLPSIIFPVQLFARAAS